MKALCFLLLIFLSTSQAFDFNLLLEKARENPENNNVGCIICTLFTSLIEQLAEIHDKTVDKVLDEVCYLFPAEAQATCLYYVNLYGEDIVKLFVAGYNADEVCHGIMFCSNPQCLLWGSSQKAKEAGIPKPSPSILSRKRATQWDPWGWLNNLINLLAQKHEPIVDIDGDLFSMEPGLRGSTWRGRDCNDFEAHNYPGKIEDETIKTIDQNCNGIYMKNNIDYEQQLCAGTGQLGAVVLGDSAGAHFHIPGDWLNASAINSKTYSNLLFDLSNELDVPQASSWTGYMDTNPNGPVESLYKTLRSRNQCNHRDYQNIAVNGLRSGSALDVAKTIARNQTLDHPVFLVLELIGNDVCSPHHDFDHFTTVADFEKNILAILEYLDTILPAGSHVLTMGLAQGSVLWDYMHARTHPIGTTYSNVYAYLNCLESNPCWTWLNSNATVRAAGDKRATELSAVYPKIIANNQFKNFDMVYYPFPLKEITKTWIAAGGKDWQLIEPVDGFHPNQHVCQHALHQFNSPQADALIAQYVVKTINPAWLGPINPNNAKISQVFGDQNGY